jgi:hypothetical protein
VPGSFATLILLAKEHGTRIDIIPVQDFNKLWLIFTEYHKEVSSFSGEMTLPDKNKFVNFWQEEKKWCFFLTAHNNPIGFVLLQIISQPEADALEVGAIFVKKKNRGISSLELYRKSLEVATENNIALSSEIALDNEHSVNIFNTLKKKYSRNTKLAFIKREIEK